MSTKPRTAKAVLCEAKAVSAQARRATVRANDSTRKVETALSAIRWGIINGRPQWYRIDGRRV